MGTGNVIDPDPDLDLGGAPPIAWLLAWLRFDADCANSVALALTVPHSFHDDDDVLNL